MSQPFSQAGAGNGGSWLPQTDLDYSYDDADPNDDGGDPNDDGDDNGDGDGGRDPKRRRIARACDMCRKKKIKCDGKMPKCSHCENYKTECVFTHVEKKRAPPKGAKYIEGLENRLGRMESLLRLSGLLGEDDGGRTDLGTLEKRLAERQRQAESAGPQSQAGDAAARAGSKDLAAAATPTDARPRPQSMGTPNGSGPTTGAMTSPEPGSGSISSGEREGRQKDGKELDALADQMCSLVTNQSGETRYIGSSSGFSIFSPKGIQWVNEKTGDTSFQHMIATADENNRSSIWDDWKPEVFNELFQRRVFKPLPPRQECYALLKDYFENFNCMFPLFHEPTFMHLVDRQYTSQPYEGSGWWASLNVALAIAHRLRVMSNVVSQDEDDIAWLYLKNAMAVTSELTMRNTDLFSVQALLGMALFLQGTPNPQPSFSLVAAAIRLAHSIGLHKRGSGFNLNAVENEQRKRVFWIAYCLDKDICLRSGRPPAQDDDDMNVELPSEDPPDNVGNIPLGPDTDSAGGRRTMNLFRLMCRFGEIQSRVYKQLYSVRASRQSDGELLNTIGELDAQLEAWKDSIPLAFRPEHEIQAAHTPLILHLVVLHFAYYNCLTTIHRMSVHHGYWTSRLSDYALQGLNARPLNPRVFMSAALCVNAARTSIGLIRYIPQGDYACVWLVLYYPVSALVTLFANILQNPQDARARSDLKLMSSVVAFLTMLERDITEAGGNVRRMLSVCAEFERIAKVALDKAEREIRGRGKRKQAERERERAMKDSSGPGIVASGLEEGKTLEQMQVETQAAYRRPLETPSLRAASDAGSAHSGSPASWNATSPVGLQFGAGRSPMAQQASAVLGGGGSQRPGHSPIPNAAQQQQQMSQQQHAANGGGSFFPPQPSHLATSQSRNNSVHQNPYTFGSPNGFLNPNGDFASTNNPAASFPAYSSTEGFPIGSTTADFSGLPFSPGGTPTLHHPHGPQHGMNGAGGMNGGGGSAAAFQQPFVPQDLWQMPMTLEWDWAEGLGLGSFTPGPMFGDAAVYGDLNGGGGGVNGGTQGMGEGEHGGQQ